MGNSKYANKSKFLKVPKTFSIWMGRWVGVWVDGLVDRSDEKFASIYFIFKNVKD